VYGPRGLENHAIIAMLARAFIGDDPYEVWGTGEQMRNRTYIDDIVAGTILAAEKIDDGTAINLGTTERITVMDAVKEMLRCPGGKARIVTRPEMPTCSLNRVADNRLAKKLLAWQPQTRFMTGCMRQSIGTSRARTATK
jgi:nucleoside-diphosphate-sugar epimerase